MIDLKRVKEYIELGYDKEEALEIVKGEEAEAKATEEEKKNFNEKHEKDVDFEEMQKKLDELTTKLEEKEKEKLSFEATEDKKITVEDAFKNVFNI